MTLSAILLIAALLILPWLALFLPAISSLTATITAAIGWNASNTLTGSDYAPNSNNSTPKKQLSLGTAAANAAAGGADELYSAITSLAGSASASIDLTSITDILATAGVSLARVKGIMIRLLSVIDDTTIGTAASAINIDNTVANALSATTNSGWFNNANEGTATGGAGDATGSKFCIPNGGVLLFATPSAGGVVTSGTKKIIKLTNLDAAVIAKVQVTVLGASS
jgi:hypothetical protein